MIISKEILQGKSRGERKFGIVYYPIEGGADMHNKIQPDRSDRSNRICKLLYQKESNTKLILIQGLCRVFELTGSKPP